MSENNDFIQLPPIKKDTPSEVVSMIWQYLKLPEESRKRVKEDLIDVGRYGNCLDTAAADHRNRACADHEGGLLLADDRYSFGCAALYGLPSAESRRDDFHHHGQ